MSVVETVNGIDLYPFGIKINDFPMQGNVLIELIKKYKIVLFRNVTGLNKDALIEFCKTLGPLLEWEFGNVMEMREHPDPKNYLFTNGPVPFHWDGAFHRVPRYLVFQCIEAPQHDGGGETLFSNTNSIWNNASQEKKTEWKNIKMIYKTEKLAHYGGCITVPLVQHHIDTDEIILRFAEPVPATMLNPVEVVVENYDDVAADQFMFDMIQRCYDKKYCYTHSWKENDLLIADNHSLIHGRNAFKIASPRHLRRIQVL